MERKDTGDDIESNEATDPTTEGSAGSGGAYGPPVAGDKANRERDAESLVDREPVEAEEGDLAPTEDPTLGKETHGG